MFKGGWRMPNAVGLRLTVLSTGVRRRYAVVFFMSWAGGYTWSCTHSQLPHFLRKKLLLFYRPGLRRSLPTSNNFLKRSPSRNRYCAPVEIWNKLCCGSLGIHMSTHLFIYSFPHLVLFRFLHSFSDLFIYMQLFHKDIYIPNPNPNPNSKNLYDVTKYLYLK